SSPAGPLSSPPPIAPQMIFRFVIPALLCSGANLSAQEPQAALPGYSPQAAQQERALEQATIQRPDSGRARALSRTLSSDVHIAGTPAQARTRDIVVNDMKQWGLPTEVRTYDVWMPHTT